MQKQSFFAFLIAFSIASSASAVDRGPDRAMDELLAQHHRADAPGCAVGVYRGSTLLHAGGYGMANLELQVPITAASAFDIGSTSKQFTAMSALLLAADGRLSLDDDIRKHLPELPAYASRITIRQLLHHTGGVRDYIDLLRMSGAHDDDVTTAKRAIDLLARQQGTHFAPGVRHQYSNSGYFLVAVIVERSSGKSLRELAQQRIFAPLDMQHTLYRDDHAELVPNRAMAYSKHEHKGWLLDVSNWEQMGDGGIVTTVADLAKWNGNFYAPVVGDASMLRTLEERGTLLDGSRIDYAMGLRHGSRKGFPTLEHAGSWGGYVSNLVRYPEQKLGVAVLCNSPDQPVRRLLEGIADLYLPPGSPDPAAGRPANRTATPTDIENLRQWVGSYQNPGSTDVVKFRINSAGALELADDRETYPVLPVGEQTLQVQGIPVDVLLKLVPGSGGSPATILQFIDGIEKDEYKFVAFEPSTATASQLQRFAGTYGCPEIQADYRVEVAGEQLELISPRGDSSRLAPREAGHFVGDQLRVRFKESGGGADSAMELGTQRAQGLRCRRR
ncbi:MAG TPA: serine hydrolase domain-containing protein [Thermomonas sp.]|nr:serine hydrolase domain-containing protein [Thermomonas sp.]